MFNFFAQPVVVAATVTGLVAVTTLGVNSWLNHTLHRERVRTDRDLARQRAEQDMRLAERKAELDRVAADWKRKADFAELLVTEFGEFVTRLRAIRNPGAYSNEAERDGRDQETPELRDARDPYWPVHRRLIDNSGFIESLYAKRFRARALFGVQSEEPFDLIATATRNVRAAAYALMNNRPLTTTERRLQLWQDHLWDDFGNEPDEVRGMSLRALDVAESIFGRYLSAGPIASDET